MTARRVFDVPVRQAQAGASPLSRPQRATTPAGRPLTLGAMKPPAIGYRPTRRPIDRQSAAAWAACLVVSTVLALTAHGGALLALWVLMAVSFGQLLRTVARP